MVRFFAAATLSLCAALAAPAHAQVGFPIRPEPFGEPQEKKIIDRYPDKPSLEPSFSIPVAPLGFTAPGSVFLFRRQAMVSLDFVDENRLLFTFRAPAPGLKSRDAVDDASSEEREMRAVVVALPDGKVESEAQWTVPDRSRYLWMLKDGRFLLRNRDGLMQGDATLKVAPFLHFPGKLLWVQMDPMQQFLIANSLEPAAQAGVVAPPPDAAGGGETANASQVLVARTLQLETGEILRMSRVPFTGQTADWPMNNDGYLESSSDSQFHWLFTLNYFTGGRRVMGRVESGCKPTYEYVSSREYLVTLCDHSGGWKLVAIQSHGAQIWDLKTSANGIWPVEVMAPDGTRLARETLLLKRTVDKYKRKVGPDDLQGQMVRVLDAADGKLELESPLTPALDGGGNVAFSPSGRRVAILNAGAIQVFELPAPAKLPDWLR
jgi:hypothetical protein